MSAMNDADHNAEAPSRDDVLAQVRAHFARLREETEAMPDNSTRKTLAANLDTLGLVADQVANATEHMDMLHAAYTYLDMSDRMVIARLPANKRAPMQKHLHDTRASVQAYGRGDADATGDVPRSLGDLAYCVHTHAGAIVSQLEAMKNELKVIGDAVQRINPPDHSKSIGATLSHMDYVLSEFSQLMVGEFPEKTSSRRHS
jgi:hypothetical protein